MKIKFLVGIFLLFSFLIKKDYLPFISNQRFEISAQAKQKTKKTAPENKKTTTKNTKTTKVQSNKPKTSADAKKRHAAAQKEIQLTEEQIRENDMKVSKSLASLEIINQEINASNERIKNLNSRISSLDKEISGLETGINKNETELERLRNEYLKAVKRLRVTKKQKSDLAFIFSSKSFNQASRRIRYLKEFSKWKNKQTKEIDSIIEDLKDQKENLAKVKEEQTVALSLQNKAKAQLAIQQRQQESLVSELKENGKNLQALLKRKQAEAKELNNMISQLIAEEQRKAALEAERKERERLMAENAKKNKEAAENKNKESSAKNNSTSSKKTPQTKNDEKAGTSNSQDYANARKRAPRSVNKTAPTETPVNADFQQMRGKLPAPTTGRFVVTSRFGRQNLPDLPDVEYENPGLDAQSDLGASARAVFKGKVSGVYLLPGYNTVVIVNHGGYYTVYGNISKPTVKTGDSVETGSNLGALALNDEDSSHTSIHFEVWKNREKLNPQEWLR